MSGDLLVEIAVRAGPRIARWGADLHVTETVSRAFAERGGTVNVPWIEGTRAIEVTPGVRDGARLVLKGFGLPKPGHPVVPAPEHEGDPYRTVDAAEHRGDLVVILRVVDRRVQAARAAGLVTALAAIAGALLELVR